MAALAIGSSVLSAVLQVVLDRATTYVQHEVLGATSKFKRSLQDLQMSLSIIKCMISDAETRVRKDRQNVGLQTWLTNLRDVVYDADYVFDMLEHRRLEKIVMKAGKSTRSHMRYATLKINFFSERVFTKRIQEIQKKLDYLLKMANYFQLTIVVDQLTPLRDDGSEARITTAQLFDDEKNFTGRDEIRNQIIDLLLNKESLNDKNKVKSSTKKGKTVVAIVGMGGIGKTTLARNIFHDNQIDNHFDLKSWVCVSDYFSVEKIKQDIIKSLEHKHSKGKQDIIKSLEHRGSKGKDDGMEDEDREHKVDGKESKEKTLHDILLGNKFFIVLDDVWNEDSEKWIELYEQLSCGEEGYKILVTCRKNSVVSAMSDCEHVELGALSTVEVFDLLMKYACCETNSKKLKDIGMKIAEKLKGSPLAAKTIGRILRTNINTKHWENILASEIWRLPQNEYDIMPALQLSYEHLAEHLKPCFAFCSIFPKDFVYDKRDMVHMWISLGLIQESPVKNMSLEDVGNVYVDDLLSASMFQSCEDKDGVFTMHDLIHDVAKMVSKDEIFVVEGDTQGTQIPKTVRHLGVYVDDLNWESLKRLRNMSSLRSLIVSYDGKSDEIMSGLMCSLGKELAKARSLRLLCLRSRNLYRFATYFKNAYLDCLDKCKCLRYLDITGSLVAKLPESLGSLYHLQVLNLEHCLRLDQLPCGIVNLMNLRHLHGWSDFKFASVNRMSLLQELSISVPQKKAGETRTLKDMKQIRDLRLSQLENITSKEDAMEIGLKNMKHLTDLHLEWTRDEESRNDVEVLKGLQPNIDIKRLSIKNYSGPLGSSWLGNQKHCLENLHEITFYECRGEDVLPPLGQLAHLKSIDLHYMRDLKEIRSDFFGHGPATEYGQECGLTWIKFRQCSALENFLPGVPPNVTILELSGCNNIGKAPASASSSTLMQLSTVGWFPATLKELTIKKCGGLGDVLEGSHLESTTLLQSLVLTGCNGIKSLPTQALQRLRRLELDNCRKLQVTPGSASNSFKHLTSLTSLSITECPKLSSTLLLLSLPGAGLPPSLEMLDIEGADPAENEDQFLREQEEMHLPQLQRINISGSDPNQVKGLLRYKCPLLTYLWIESFPGVESLEDYMANFPSLKSLYLYDLPDLVELSNKLSQLPIEDINITDCEKVVIPPKVGVPPKLKRMWINSCPDLVAHLSEEWRNALDDFTRYGHNVCG